MTAIIPIFVPLNCTYSWISLFLFKDLREKIDLEDNLFLDRYAQSVTENGETINTDNSTIPGYGVWRLTEDDFVHILSVSKQRNSSGDNSSI